MKEVTMTDNPAPGWYPDPEGRGVMRYWNGAAWTDYRSFAGRMVTKPSAARPVPEAVRRRSTKRWLIFGGVVLAGAIAVGVFASDGDEPLVRDLTPAEWAELRAECIADGKKGFKEIQDCAVDRSLVRYPARDR